MNIANAGDHAVLVQLDAGIDASDLHAHAARVRALPGVLACVVGHSSLYVVFSSRPDFSATDHGSPRGDARHSTEHRIPVAFDGADVDEFLARTKLSRSEFLSRVASLRLVVRYLGFRGGFAYLDGWPAEWAMPRRPTSRPVARGSFAIAASVAGFYPIDSPGGWNILGRTSEALEYRFAAGDRIVLLPVDQIAAPAPGSLAHARDDISAPFMTRIESANWNNLEHGKPVGGAFDPELAAAVDAEYEFAQVGPRITKPGAYVWADLDGVRTIEVRDRFEIGRIKTGFRGYLGVSATAAVPGRRSDRHVIHTMRGPHDIGVDELECEVTPALDRVGIRLRPSMKLDAPADMPSCGMQFGTLQLHPDGSIVAMGPDHPVTGGYLQPMTVLWSERWKLAHLSPGERVRFVAQSP